MTAIKRGIRQAQGRRDEERRNKQEGTMREDAGEDERKVWQTGRQTDRGETEGRKLNKIGIDVQKLW